MVEVTKDKYIVLGRGRLKFLQSLEWFFDEFLLLGVIELPNTRSRYRTFLPTDILQTEAFLPQLLQH